MKIILLGFTLVFVTGCATSGASNNTVPVGAHWELTRQIEFRPRHSIIYIQDGEVVKPGWKGNQYQAYCDIENKAFSKQRRYIKSGTFEITRVSYDTKAISESNSRYSTIMTVKSLEHPEIQRIGCHHWDDNAADYMPITKMQETMKGIFTLHMPVK